MPKKHDPHLLWATQVLEVAEQLELMPLARLFAAIYPRLEGHYAGYQANIAANEAKWRRHYPDREITADAGDEWDTPDGKPPFYGGDK